jgi:hypothetical protein
MANDFSGDSHCKAVWNVDDGALTTDSKGTNTLTNNNVTANTSSYKQGDASAEIDSLTDRLYIADADLDAGFPFKNSGGATTLGTAGWFYIDALPAAASRYLWGKWAASGQSWLLYITPTDKHLAIGIGHSGGNELLDTEYEIQPGRWYHVGANYSATTKAWNVRLWDDTAGSVVYSDGGTSTNTAIVGTAEFKIGGISTAADGRRDEVVVFDDALSDDEIDWIRGETYAVVDAGEDSAALLLGMNF